MSSVLRYMCNNIGKHRILQQVAQDWSRRRKLHETKRKLVPILNTCVCYLISTASLTVRIHWLQEFCQIEHIPTGSAVSLTLFHSLSVFLSAAACRHMFCIYVGTDLDVKCIYLLLPSGKFHLYYNTHECWKEFYIILVYFHQFSCFLYFFT